MEGGDDLHRGVDVAQGDDHGPVAHGVGHGLAPLGADDDVDAEAFGGGQEILGPVGLGGQEEEYAGHHPRMARNDRDVTGTAMTDDDPTEAPVLTLTDKALAKVLELRSDEGAAESLALWVEISGTSGDAYTYDMYFQAASDAGPDAWTGVQDGLTIVVPAASAPNMVGSVLDLNRDLLAGGHEHPQPEPSPSAPGQPDHDRSPAGPERGRGPAGHPGARRPDQPVHRRPRRPRRPRRGGRRGRLPAPERRLRRLRDGRGDPQPGHRGGHQAIGARDRPHRRRDRSRLGHQPVLRGGQEVTAVQLKARASGPTCLTEDIGPGPPGPLGGAVGLWATR